MDGYRRMQTRTQTNERLMTMIDELQRQLEEQRREIAELRANGSNGAPRGNEVPPPPPPQPQVNEVPAPTAEPRAVYQEPLLVRWKRVKPADFEGSKDPLVAQGWLKTIEATLRLMGFTDNEKVLCASYCLTMEARIWWDGIEQSRNVEVMTWADFVHEFNTKFFHMNITRKHYDEFENLRQGDMTVTDVVAKFDQLARLCPGMVSDEGERVRRLIRVLRPEIAAIVDGASPPRSQEQVVLRAQRAEFHLSKLRRNQPQPSQQTNQASHQNRPPFRNNNNNNNQNWRNNNNKRKGNPQNHQGQGNKRHNGGQHNNNRQVQACPKCGKNHPGECRMGSNKCFVCGQEGHFVKNCPRMMNAQTPISQRVPPAQLHHMQASLEGPLISQGRLEAPPTNARIYAMTKEQVAAEASNVVTGQITSLSTNAYVLFDTGATHSFVSSTYVKKLRVHLEPMRQGFTTTLPSGEVIISMHCLHVVHL